MNPSLWRATRRLAFESVGYVPTPTQLVIHDDTHPLKVVAGGERAGKSRTSGMEGFGNGPLCELIWAVGPDYYQARPEFAYVRDAFLKLDAIEHLSEPEDGRCVLIVKGGLKVVTRSGEDVKKLASEAPDGILMTEAAQQTFANFQKLHNRLLEARKRGRGFMYVSGTFEGSLGWYPEIYNLLQGPNLWGGRSFSLPTASNTAVFPLGGQDPELLALRARLDEATFLERFEGVPCPPKELVFPEFRHTVHVADIRFGDVETATRDVEGWILPKSIELELWIDPGYAGAYAVLFVAIDGGLVFVVDEIYGTHKTGPTIITEAMAKPELFERVRRGVIDIAGRQHNAMESQVELWQRTTGIPFRSNRVLIPDGIIRYHTFLVDPLTRAPRIFYDRKCVGAIGEHGKYRYPEYKELRDERELPIDANNHALKAAAYGLIERFGVVDRLKKPEPRNLIKHRSRS